MGKYTCSVVLMALRRLLETADSKRPPRHLMNFYRQLVESFSDNVSLGKAFFPQWRSNIVISDEVCSSEVCCHADLSTF